VLADARRARDRGLDAFSNRTASESAQSGDVRAANEGLVEVSQLSRCTRPQVVKRNRHRAVAFSGNCGSRVASPLRQSSERVTCAGESARAVREPLAHPAGRFKVTCRPRPPVGLPHRARGERAQARAQAAAAEHERARRRYRRRTRALPRAGGREAKPSHPRSGEGRPRAGRRPSTGRLGQPRRPWSLPSALPAPALLELLRRCAVARQLRGRR
jgi:hypothetical protein